MRISEPGRGASYLLGWGGNGKTQTLMRRIRLADEWQANARPARKPIESPD